MFIKKFEAPSLEEALKRAKGELGSGALVLSTVNHKGSFVKKGFVEVTVAVEKKTQELKKEALDIDQLMNVFPHRRTAKKRVDFHSDRSTTKEENTTGKRYIDIGVQSEKTREPNDKNNSSRFEESFLRLGVCAETARALGHRLVMDNTKGELANPRFLEKAKVRLLAKDLKTISFEGLMQRRFWMPVGAAGVGKTSFLVKLAALCKGKNVAVAVSSRDRRKLIGSAEMAGYARVMKVPFLFDLREMRGEKICLIDCPAFSFEADEVNQEIERILSQFEKHSSFLVLDSTARLNEMMRMFDLASRFHIEAVAFTKMDVASNLGAIYDFVRRTKLPILGGSVSQSFAVGLQLFSAGELAQMILTPGTLVKSREIAN